MIAVILLASNIVFAQAVRTSDDWFTLAVAIQRDIEQADFENRKLENIDAEDRRFVRKMINELSVSADAKPTAEQGVWLLKIYEWVKAK